MAEEKQSKRSYNSTRRRAQAMQTRRSILDAAYTLFRERGYAATTIEAIAGQAGVAPETIYAVFGSKSVVLRNLFEITLVGDEEPVALLDRPFIREKMRERDPQRMVRNFAADIYQIMRRVGPVFALLRTAARSDLEIEALQQRILNERLGGMGHFVRALGGITPLREGLDPDQAAATVWAVSSAEVFELLTGNLGWGEEQYVDWLSASLERLLLA